MSFIDPPVNPHPRATSEYYTWEREHADEIRQIFQRNLAFATSRNDAECREQGITGRPTIKPDGKPLTQNERNHRHQRKLKSVAADGHAEGVQAPRKRGRPATRADGRPLTPAEISQRYRERHHKPEDVLHFAVKALRKERDQLKSENAALKAKLYDMNAILSMTS